MAPVLRQVKGRKKSGRSLKKKNKMPLAVSRNTVMEDRFETQEKSSLAGRSNQKATYTNLSESKLQSIECT